MKKVNKNIKKKIAKRIVKSKINPLDWWELDNNNKDKVLNKLINEYVIIHIYKGMIPKYIETGPPLIYRVPVNIHYGEMYLFNTLHGTISKFLSKFPVIPETYYFLFNPLNQWKYQENAKLPITHNDHLAFLEEDALFEHNEPTYQFEFQSFQIEDIINNNIFLKVNKKVKIEPINS